jgi:hypothetical protein
MRPSTILKWPESFPRFRRRCLLPRSRCLGAHPMTPSTWRFWASRLPNSRSWRSGAHGLSGLLRGSTTYSLGQHPIGPTWPIVWMRPLDNLRQSWLHGGRRMLSWRIYGLQMCKFRTLVLDSADAPSSLAASLSTAVELLVRRIDATTANRVH